MTDAELTALFAEKVLGWEFRYRNYKGESIYYVPKNSAGGNLCRCNPLRSETDAWRGVDAHPEWAVSIGRAPKGGPYAAAGWIVSLKGPEPAGRGGAATVTDPDRRRALVLACLRAVGERV